MEDFEFTEPGSFHDDCSNNGFHLSHFYSENQSFPLLISRREDESFWRLPRLKACFHIAEIIYEHKRGHAPTLLEWIHSMEDHKGELIVKWRHHDDELAPVMFMESAWNLLNECQIEHVMHWQDDE